MSLDKLLKKASEREGMFIKNWDDGEIMVFVKTGLSEDLVFRIYPETKTVECPDVDRINVYDGLKYALEESYEKFPEILKIYNYLCNKNYNFGWWAKHLPPKIKL